MTDTNTNPQNRSVEAPSQVEQLKRRTERILLRIPIDVAGIGSEGKSFNEKTHTLAINRHGARIALSSGVQPEARVTITNLQNRITSTFRVVRQMGKSPGEKPEWGVECLQPEVNFWGIFFPPKADTPTKGELIDVLLECSRCHARELAQLTLEQYQTIITQPSLSRGCTTCVGTTEWTFGFVEGDRAGAPRAPAVSAPSPVPDRRGNKRVTVKLPVRIRLEEIGQTENLSHSGVCFSSNLIMRVGDRVMLTVGYGPGADSKEVLAQVVWRRQVAGADRALYGVQLEESD